MALALAVLAVVAAITWPAVQRVYDDYAVRQGAEQVRVKLAGARVYAINSGMVYQFRYEPGGRRYVVIPYEQEFSSATGFGTAPETSLAAAQRMDSAQLDEGLVFYSLDPTLGGSEQVPQDWFAGLPNAPELAATSWSPPLLFFADGTSQSGGFLVADAKGNSVPIGLRGLTGAPQVGRVQREALR